MLENNIMSYYNFYVHFIYMVLGVIGRNPFP